MNYYPYHVDDEEMVELLDREFMVVATVGFPEDGLSPGYDLCIYDTRTKDEIANAIDKVYDSRASKA